MKMMMGSFDRDTVAKACWRLRSRIEDVMAADSHFIAQINAQYVPLIIFFTSIKSDDFQLCCVIF